eukprot:3185737-Rhodomonas_salina.2
MRMRVLTGWKEVPYDGSCKTPRAKSIPETADAVHFGESMGSPGFDFAVACNQFHNTQTEYSLYGARGLSQMISQWRGGVTYAASRELLVHGTRGSVLALVAAYLTSVLHSAQRYNFCAVRFWSVRSLQLLYCTALVSTAHRAARYGFGSTQRRSVLHKTELALLGTARRIAPFVMPLSRITDSFVPGTSGGS